MAIWQFKLLYDGECPFCKFEASYMARIDGHSRLILEDITGPDFDPDQYGVTIEALMGTLHGVFPDGRMTVGLATFREVYRTLGIGWILAPTGWPILKQISDWIYTLFARNRVRLGSLFGRGCASDRCALPRSTAGARHNEIK